jgi:hypothetical protein
MKNSVLVLLFGTVLLTAQTPKSDAREAVKQVPRIFVAELHFPLTRIGMVWFVPN